MFEDKEKTMDAMQEPSGNLLNIGKIETVKKEVIAEPPEEEATGPIKEAIVESSEEADAEPAKEKASSGAKREKKKSNPKKIVSIIGIVCGAIILFMGFYALGGGPYDGPEGTYSNSTSYTSYEVYGGDAYSGIQQAGADASNNAAIAADNVAISNSYLRSIAEMVSKLVGYLLIAFGLMTICGSAYGLASAKRE